MGQLFERIQKLVLESRYVVGEHAFERLDERGILEWQIIDGIETGRLLKERPRDLPNPIVEICQTLADGTEVKAVWSLVIQINVAKLVTIHYI
jgi:hypothetical protein